MKKSKKVLFFVVMIALFLGVYAIGNVVLDDYISGPQYKILKYKVNDSTENLIDVCNTLIVGGNDEFLDYADVLLARPDFKEVYTKGDTSLSWERYNDLLILQAFKCIAKSDETTALEVSIIKYFPMAKMSEPLAHLSYALGENTKFANENKELILNTIIQLFNTSTEDKKQTYLEYIVAYYNYFNINNESSQKYIDILNDLIKNMENYEKKFCYSDIEFAKSCWGCMFTGVYNEEINDYYNFMFLEEVAEQKTITRKD